MNSKTKFFSLFSIGMAMFSMFFGAGNIVFPLGVGQLATSTVFYALIGLVITAVIVPFTGVFAVMLYNGDYKSFFSRLGKWPAFLIALTLMALIGPFGAIPRCIALSFSTTKMFFSQVPMIPFILACCLLIYVTTIKKTRVIDFVGVFLAPFFLLSLALIVVLGILDHPLTTEPTAFQPFAAFTHGLVEGYYMMDLLGSFFFSTVVIAALRKVSTTDGVVDSRLMIKNSLISSVIGAFLMAVVYIGMSYVAALHSSSLVGCRKEVLLGTIALQVLGSYAGIATCLAVVFACLTTAIALTAVFAEFFQQAIMKDRISYRTSLIVTLAVAFFMSTLEFSGIMAFLMPVVKVLYPALLLLSLWNIASKLWHQRKAPLVLESSNTTG